jgi:uncharacterized repeat protein (TIGR03837 family)
LSLIDLQSSWDIFCKVVDNYGDIGVCWRLARQLAADHALTVRLWVDDLNVFARLYPAIDLSLNTQRIGDIAVCRWRELFPDAVPGAVVVEAFGCRLPAAFEAAMAAKSRAPIWINLEYLSAEEWVTENHRLPSPQSTLTKYFFFPGFVAATGGLLREWDLIARRDRFQRDPQAINEFWRSLELESPKTEELRVSLFCYDNPALHNLFTQWAAGSSPVTCVVPEGLASSAVARFFAERAIGANRNYAAGNLSVRVIPLLEHERYDRLLWACDINFVRGEDSFVRAQWAARPFVWNIYPQKEATHRMKLDAFLDLFCAGMEMQSARRLRSFSHGWNGDGLQDSAWRELVAVREALASHALTWSLNLAQQPDLASNLVNFSRDLLKSRVST